MIDQMAADRIDGAAFAFGRRSNASATRTKAIKMIHSNPTYAE